MIFTEECLHSEKFPRKCSTKMSRSTSIPAERWCVEVNKDGEEGISKENTTGVQNPQYRITTESSRIQYYGTGENAGECPEQHTHTLGGAIQKQNRACCPSNFPSIFFIVIIIP